MKEITPEEKLLRLIKSKKNITEKSIEKPKEIIKKEAISNTFTAKTKIPKDKKESLIGNLSIALIFLLIATAIYFIVDFLVITPYSRHKLNNIELESKSPIDEKTISPKEAPKKESIKPYSYYSENIANRDIFRPLVQKEGKVLEGGVSKIREKFNITGII